MEEIRAHVFIEGLVQGVFFRASTKEEAVTRGLLGWVKNNTDGTVEAVFEGKDADIHSMLEWCRVGPPDASVKSLNVNFEDFIGEFKEFSVDTAY